MQLEQGAPEKREFNLQPLREACQQFEGIFISAMLRAMRNTLPTGGILPASISRKVWESQFDAVLGDALGKTGSLGLAEMLYEDVVGNSRGKARGIRPVMVKKILR